MKCHAIKCKTTVLIRTGNSTCIKTAAVSAKKKTTSVQLVCEQTAARLVFNIKSSFYVSDTIYCPLQYLLTCI